MSFVKEKRIVGFGLASQEPQVCSDLKKLFGLQGDGERENIFDERPGCCRRGRSAWVHKSMRENILLIVAAEDRGGCIPYLLSSLRSSHSILARQVVGKSGREWSLKPERFTIVLDGLGMSPLGSWQFIARLADWTIQRISICYEAK